MFTKQTAILIAASFLLFGIAGLALAEDKAAGYPILAQDQTRDRDHLRDGTGDGVPDRIRDQDRLKDGTGASAADQLLDKTQDRDRLRDGTGDGVPDRIRDHDRLHDSMGTRGGMGGGMRGSRR